MYNIINVTKKLIIIYYMFKKIAFFVLLQSIFILSSSTVLAACDCVCNGPSSPGVVDTESDCQSYCDPNTYTCTPITNTGSTPGGSAPITLANPFGATLTPQTLIGKIISAALGIVGSLALLMFIYGGFTWMTSAGSPDKVTKGKGIMVWAAIGLAVIFSSYALVKFVIDGLMKTT